MKLSAGIQGKIYHRIKKQMPENKNTAQKFEKLIIILYFVLYSIIGLSMVYKQPFGNPPDEYNRYLIPEYIAEHGALPNGYEEEIRIGGYGFSYGFQPILPYMLQGYAMRFVKLFTSSRTALFYTARLIDFAMGFLMAYFVLLLSRKWFSDRRLSWLFSFLVTFLPQSIFVHTYVNTDSCCMLSIAIMLYGLTKGLEEDFSTTSCILLSVGIVLCALSYYNAYGYILSCILLFLTFFCNWHSRKPSFTWKPLLQKGLFISLLVLAGISWWFIRSYLLYDGDILGLKTRDACAALYALPEFHPDTRVTWQNQGYSILEMLTGSDFLTLTQLSFIGVYGPMTIITSLWVYRFYKLLFGLGLFLSIFLPVSFLREKACGSELHLPFLKNRPVFRFFYHCNMVFCILMPCALSIWYSYTTDYQPQGRYVLPALIPLCYYCVRGLEKGFLAIKKPMKNRTALNLLTGLCTIICILIIILLFVTVYGYAFPYYEQHPVAP